MSDLVMAAIIGSVPATIAAIGSIATSSQVRALRDEIHQWQTAHESDGHGGSGVRRWHMPRPRRPWQWRRSWQWQPVDRDSGRTVTATPE